MTGDRRPKGVVPSGVESGHEVPQGVGEAQMLSSQKNMLFLRILHFLALKNSVCLIAV